MKFKNVKTYSELQIDKLFATIESKFNPSVDGSEFYNDTSISNNDQLLLKIKDIINDERIKVDITSSSKNIKEANYIISFKISVDHKIFKNKSKNLKLKLIGVKLDMDHNLNENLLKEINDLALYNLLAIDCNSKNDINLVGKKYRICISGLHPDKRSGFFRNWYEKLKNKKINKRFDEIYAILSFKIFEILEYDVKKVKVILGNLNCYDEKILKENEYIEKFCRYMDEIIRLINNKWNGMNK